MPAGAGVFVDGAQAARVAPGRSPNRPSAERRVSERTWWLQEKGCGGGSAFDGAGGEAGDEVALEDGEADDDGEGHDQ